MIASELLIAVAMLTGCVVFLLPAPAMAAGNARKDGSKLIYVGGGETNSLTVSYGGGTYTFVDSAAGTVTAGSGCTQTGGNYWGGGADTVVGGNGDDSLDGAAEDDRVTGEHTTAGDQGPGGPGAGPSGADDRRPPGARRTSRGDLTRAAHHRAVGLGREAQRGRERR